METTILAFGLGMPEVILVLAVVLILFGAKKLPELARGMGKGIKEFKNATREIQDDLEQAMDEDPPPPPNKKPSAESSDHWTDKTVTKKSDSGD
jgi:sec-independent protein translocase protein TatA